MQHTSLNWMNVKSIWRALYTVRLVKFFNWKTYLVNYSTLVITVSLKNFNVQIMRLVKMHTSGSRTVIKKKIMFSNNIRWCNLIIET